MEEEGLSEGSHRGQAGGGQRCEEQDLLQDSGDVVKGGSGGTPQRFELVRRRRFCAAPGARLARLLGPGKSKLRSGHGWS